MAAQRKHPSWLSPARRHPPPFPQPFFCQHDILLAAEPQTEDELDAMIEGVLAAAGGT